MVELLGNLATLLLLAGAGLIIAEAFAPGAHFIVLGIALLGAGLVGLALPGSLGLLATTVVLAATVMIIGGAALYGYREFDIYGGKGTAQTSDSESLRGQTGRVTERVTATGGEIKLDKGGFNPYYQARALDDEIDEGTEVIVVDPGGGNVLTVENFEDIEEDEIDRELARGREREDREREQNVDTA
ncbi:NfeD family protein [Halapricum desulfuricans]|uniref:Membrane protein n=1 Tax=Halapricum desulfuricans TaxID=2841257 RepID=A0A897NQ26_9EURY|nr:NfeD family protein [Halapricum desulfuricans]QSG09396.1 Membrane protein [Halapricum desulfuricans]QSG12296.1 Membrane protein [Halapricum desulfuricans]